MSKIVDWLTYQRDLPPDAANPQGRKTATRLFHIGMALWLFCVTAVLLKALNHHWPKDKELAQAGLSALGEERAARAAEQEAASARADVEFSKQRPTKALTELADAEKKHVESQAQKKAIDGNPNAAAELKQNAAKELKAAEDRLASAKLAAKPDQDALQAKDDIATEKERTAARARAVANNSGESPDHARQMLLIVMVLGALGGQIHALCSFATYWGNQTFVSSWAFYYIVRPVVGGLLALIIYLGLLGGVLGVSVSQAASSNLAIGTICLLSGLCSEMAVDKFVEVFKLLFQTEKAKERRDTLDHVVAVPKVSRLAPAQVSLAGLVAVKLHGVNFSANSKARINGVEVNTDFKSPTELELPVASLPGVVGKVKITVIDKATGTESSPAVELDVTP